MAAAFQKLRFAWSFRAVFAGRVFVINTLYQAKATNRATTHIRKGVCREWLFMFFLFIFQEYLPLQTNMLQVKIKFRLKFFNLG